MLKFVFAILLYVFTWSTAQPKAWIGIAFEDVPLSQIPTVFEHPHQEGCVQIRQVFPGSSGAQADLREKDYILAIDGVALKGRRSLIQSIQKKKVGTVITLTLGREGTKITQKMALSPKPEDIISLTKTFIGSPAPSWQGRWYSGINAKEKVELTQFKGKVVLLDFWATWCGPCQMTLPTLSKLHQAYKSEGLVVVGASSEDLATLQEFQKRSSVPYPLFNDVGRLTAMRYQAMAYPTHVLIDRQGTIQRIEVGAHPYSTLEKWVRELL